MLLLFECNKQVTYTMYNLPACRSCLKVNCKLYTLSDANRKLFTTLTGLAPNLVIVKSFPSQFCGECLMYIKKAKAFRAKARRAHFVLTEINTLRKIITYKDILSVDRKITNLKSSLGYSDGNHIICGEIEYSADLTNNNDNKHTVKTCQAEIIQNENTSYKNNNKTETIVVQKLIDIKSEFVQDDIVEAPPEADSIQDDVPEKEEQNTLLNIDLENVFKDLQDNDEDTDFEWEEQKPDQPKETKKPSLSKPSVKTKGDERAKETVKLKKHPCKTPAKIYDCSRALLNSKIEVLSDKEQMEVFIMRTIQEPFKSALFKCLLCIKVLDNLHHLKSHANFHNHDALTQKHKCNVCKQKFTFLSNLEMHIAEEHQYRYTCKKCFTVVYTMDELLAHQTKHDTEIWNLKSNYKIKCLSPAAMYQTMAIETKDPSHEFMCQNCKISFLTKMELTHHSKLHLEGNKGVLCDVLCDICKIWLPKTLMKDHMEEWHLYAYACNKCPDVFRNVMQAKLHLVHKHNTLPPTDLTPPYKCVKCDKNFNTLTWLESHLRIKHKTNKKHFCFQCGVFFENKMAFYLHQLSSYYFIQLAQPLHADGRYACSECNCQFVNERALTLHNVQMGHKKSDVRIYNCLCGVRVKSLKSIRDHWLQALCSGAEMAKTCTICQGRFQNQNELQEHHKAEHPNDIFVNESTRRLCDLCGQMVFGSGLPAHRKRHERECPYCKHDCPNPTALIQHIIVYHSSQPYVCAICDMHFETRGSCKNHILKQHEPIRFKCDFCDESFVHGAAMRTHCKIHNRTPETYFRRVNYQRTLSIHPHMKLDVSLVPAEILVKEIKLRMFPFYGIKGVFFIKDYKKYLITKQNPDNILIRSTPAEMAVAKRSSLQAKKRSSLKQDCNYKTTSTTEAEDREKENVTIQNPNLGKHQNPDVIDSSSQDFKKPETQKRFGYELVKMDIREQIDNCTTDYENEETVQATNSLREYEVLEMKTDNNDLVEEQTHFGADQFSNDDDVHMNNVELQGEDEKGNILEIDSTDIIEKDGEFYVSMNGELYKLEQE